MSSIRGANIRVRYLLRPVDDRLGNGDLPLLSVSATRGVMPRQDLADNSARANDLSIYKVCRVGDIVVNRMSAYQGALGMTDRDGVVSPDYLVLRPRAGIEPRWLHHVMRSQPFVAEMTSRVRGIGSVGTGNVRTPRVSAEEIGEIRIHLPERSTQHAIADFLDAETARIDGLMAKKSRLVLALDEWEQAAILEISGDWRKAETASLRRLGTAVLTGPFGTQLAAAEYERGGVPVVNPTHIRLGRIEAEDDVTVSVAVANRLNRHRLRHGDLVLGRKGDVGRSALVSAQQDGWVCGSDSIAVRCDPKRLLAEYLACLLHTSYFREQLLARSTGAMVANVNESALLDVQVPNTSIDEQDQALPSLRRTRSLHEDGVALIATQMKLLHEHRQALITAAVTGELDLPEVAA